MPWWPSLRLAVSVRALPLVFCWKAKKAISSLTNESCFISLVQFIGFQLAPLFLCSSDHFTDCEPGQLAAGVCDCLGSYWELRNVPNTVCPHGLLGRSLVCWCREKKGQVQVGYMPAVWLRQSLVPAAGGKGWCGDCNKDWGVERDDTQDAGWGNSFQLSLVLLFCLGAFPAAVSSLKLFLSCFQIENHGGGQQPHEHHVLLYLWTDGPTTLD